MEKRKNDPILRKKIIDFFGNDFPTFLEIDQKYGFFSRCIPTPNTECKYFIDLATSIDLKPCFLEYDDKVVSRNPDKYHLCTLYLYKRNKNGVYETHSQRIVDFNEYEGSLFSEINTLWGEPLREFHLNLLKEEGLYSKMEIKDITSWFNLTRLKGGYYYFYFLSLFIYHGILFENYLLEDREEGEFINAKVLTSILAIEKFFGVKPLIVPLLPLEVEKHMHWLSYDNEKTGRHIEKLNVVI